MPQDGNFTFSRQPVSKFVKGPIGVDKNSDPTFLGFVFLFDFSNKSQSPLLVNNANQTGTALNYLNRLGDTARVRYLQTFINLLQRINKELPWYWQSIEGVDQLWNYEGFKDPYRGGINTDRKISVNCLESIDLKITALMDLYRKAAFDLENRRWILPFNLQQFRVWIFVQELRKFQVIRGSGSDSGSAKESTNEKSPYLFFELTGCHWIPDDSSGFLSELSNVEPEASTQQVSFSWENVHERGNQFPLESIKISDTNKIQNKDTYEQDQVFENQGPTYPFNKLNVPSTQEIQDFASESINNFSGNLQAFAENQLAAQISSAIQGNVFGISPTNALAALQQGGVQSLGDELISRATEGGPSTLGQVYQPSPQINQGGGREDLGNVFN